MVERHLRARKPVSRMLADPDHPWVKGTGRAAVRMAMTVAEAGTKPGVLGRTALEAGRDADAAVVLRLRRTRGTITAKLTVRAHMAATVPLLSRRRHLQPLGQAARRGLHALARARALVLGLEEGLEAHIRP